MQSFLAGCQMILGDDLVLVKKDPLQDWMAKRNRERVQRASFNECRLLRAGPLQTLTATLFADIIGSETKRSSQDGTG